ncbi:MAG: hypothetical protein IMW94_10635 [Thermoanaerobacter sp.]|nr:hypothetical protein [Thermoanaerobacter sp.]
MPENNPCSHCAELKRQIARLQEEIRQLRIDNERLRKVFENISFSASAAVIEKC